MGVIPASFGLEAGSAALGLDLGGQAGDALRTRAEAKPNHAGHAALLECPHVAQGQLERGQAGGREAVKDSLGQPELDMAEEPDRQVQVGRRRPAKVRRAPRALGQIAVEGLAVLLGQRQPEERPDL